MSTDSVPLASTGSGAVNALQQRLDLEHDAAEDWNEHFEISRRFLASSVGFVALGLPVLMLAFGISGCFFDSISHYYYGAVVGTLFTGFLFFIGSFLLAYRSVKWVTRLSRAAGLFAFGVAIFPTNGTGCQDGTFWGRPIVALKTNAEGNLVGPVDPTFSLASQAATAHFVSAALLFLVLAFFCFFVFTRVLPKHRLPNGLLKPEKARRNLTYKICGCAILFAMAAIATSVILGEDWSFWDSLNLTFWFETLALWAFGVSWALKGRLGPFSAAAVGRFVLDPEDRLAPGKSMTGGASSRP